MFSVFSILCTLVQRLIHFCRGLLFFEEKLSSCFYCANVFARNGYVAWSSVSRECVFSYAAAPCYWSALSDTEVEMAPSTGRVLIWCWCEKEEVGVRGHIQLSRDRMTWLTGNDRSDGKDTQKNSLHLIPAQQVIRMSAGPCDFSETGHFNQNIWDLCCLEATQMHGMNKLPYLYRSFFI